MSTKLTLWCGGVSAVALALLCLGFTCNQEPASPVIAHVGNAVLTLDDLYQSIPPEYSDRISPEQHINYVKQWIDNELLYQEARRRKLHREASIKKRLEKMKKDLLCAELMSRSAVSSDKIRISEEMVRDYYEKNKESFTRQRDVVRFMQIVVDGLGEAWRIRQKVRADNFQALAAKYSQVPVEDPEKVSYVTVDQIPKEIADALGRLREGGTTAPIKTAVGYHIIRLMDKHPKGTTATLNEVREDIIDRLSTQVQKQKINEMLSELRLKTDVGFHFDRIPAPEEAAVSDSAS